MKVKSLKEISLNTNNTGLVMEAANRAVNRIVAGASVSAMQIFQGDIKDESARGLVLIEGIRKTTVWRTLWLHKKKDGSVKVSILDQREIV